jgi:Uma2 family endonuclease
LIPSADDGIVVVVTTEQYLYSTEETNRKRELAFGKLREPPAPFFSHQELVLRVARLLCSHVEPRHLGKVAVAPVDVILDHERALIVQPDVLFVSQERLSIVRDQVWGAPDLVVEVLSSGTERRDRHEKLGWYREYGVRECWLVDLFHQQVVIVDFIEPAERASKGVESIRSAVLPSLEASAFGVFA